MIVCCGLFGVWFRGEGEDGRGEIGGMGVKTCARTIAVMLNGEVGEEEGCEGRREVRGVGWGWNWRRGK